MEMLNTKKTYKTNKVILFTMIDDIVSLELNCHS